MQLGQQLRLPRPGQLGQLGPCCTARLGPSPSARLAASGLGAALPRLRAVAARAQVGGAGSAGGASGKEPEERPPGFVANLLKPLRDFGIGRSSMVQGGVGLFVFAGIGAPLVRRAARAPSQTRRRRRRLPPASR